MRDTETEAEPRDHEPRPVFLERLREVVHREVGLTPPPGPRDETPFSNSDVEFDRAPPAIPGIEIHHEIGRGGMGTVYRARQIGLNRIVALKLVWLGRGRTNRNAIELARGPRTIASLSHPNIIQIFHVGKHDGWVYGVFEYLEGGNLKDKIKDGPWSPVQAASLLLTLAETVDFMHERGVVHRDLKSSNILLTSQGIPKIADFGLVKLLGDDDTSLGESGSILGSPNYMAPEQATGNASAVGPASDIHALGAILHELLIGRPPFLGSTRAETLRQVVELIPDPPSWLRSEVPPTLDAICLRSLQKDPRRRYPSARQLADDLSRFLEEAESPRS